MSRLWYHIKEGFRGVFRHLAMSLSSASAVTITLILVGVFLVINACLQQVTTGLEESVQIVAKIDEAYNNDEGIEALQKQISQIAGVEVITYSSKDDQLQVLIDQFPDGNGDIFESYMGTENPLQAAFNVSSESGTDIALLSEQITAIEGISRVLNGGVATVNFVNSLSQIRQYGYFVVLALGFLAIFLIANTIRITIYSRNREISIMRTVGASNWFIRMPFLIEGMIIGLLGSIIPVAIITFGYNFLYNKVGGFILSSMFVLPPVMPLVKDISLIIVGIGVLVGLVGSFFSISKHLRWSR